MRTDAPLAPSVGDQEVDDFLDVILEDPDLLAVEFQAIVENAWGGSQTSAGPPVRRVPRRRASWHPVARRSVPRQRAPVHRSRPRVRSPPVVRSSGRPSRGGPTTA
ncbi:MULTISPECIES: hypothetical protein [unclassified Knoellia]|uniref:hypothetical protein n=1 Tax=Knoellia altitudinis TaxID=3404795 RepID=UPI0036215E2F